jgi:hypothetical protein
MSESSQLPLFHVVGFSGHRTVDDLAGVAKSILSVLESLRKEASGEWLALSSVADGSDQMFVAQARSLGMSWHAVLPLPEADFASDFSPTDWPAVKAMLATAEHKHVIAEAETRADAYLDCGLETVNGSDVLLAVWDGQPARGKGGTAEVVAYAESIGKPLIVIDPTTLSVQRKNFDNLKRDDQHLKTLNHLPDASGGWGENPFNAPANIFAFQQKCDHAATRGAPYFRRLIVATVIFHVAATLIAAGALAFNLHWVLLPWLKLACLIGALGAAWIAHHHQHSMHNWVSCRLAAEFCRSALATWGLPRATPLFEDVHLSHVRGLTRTLHVLHSRSATAQSVSMEEFKRLYLEKRIGDQLAYYRKQEERALPLFGRLRRGFWVATLVALLCTLAYAIAHTGHLHVPDWVTNTVFYFLPISLPVVAASFISLVSINDLQRRVARYREMHLMLEDSRRRIEFCQTWNSLERVVFKTERALRQEMMEWHSITSFTESH